MLDASPFAPPATAPLQPLDLSWARDAGVELAMLRLDSIDPQLSGNKWYKLAPCLAACSAQPDGTIPATGLISLGGPHSNHLHALAAAGQRFGLATVGLLRGEPCQTPTVVDLQQAGMTLHWLGYGGYRARHQPGFWAPWQALYPGFVCIEEGGCSLAAAESCARLVGGLRGQLGDLGWDDYTALWLAAGTGTTLAGLVIGEAGAHPVYGALAGPLAHGVGRAVAALLEQAGRLDAGYCLIEAARGGFGRIDETLLAFMADTEAETGVPLDPVYTAKALLALRLAIAAGRFTPGSRIIVVHTGGLQGRRTLPERAS